MSDEKEKPVATGYIRLNGRKVRVLIWKNKWKQNKRHPDWNVVLREGLFEAHGGLWKCESDEGGNTQ